MPGWVVLRGCDCAKVGPLQYHLVDVLTEGVPVHLLLALVEPRCFQNRRL
jgi:hypothetical protein